MMHQRLIALVCIIILFYNSTALPAIVAGTLIKTPFGLVLVERLRVGDHILAPHHNRELQAVRITHITEGLADTIYNVQSERGLVSATPKQKFYDPLLDKWVSTQDLTSNNFFLDSSFSRCKCINISSSKTPTKIYNVSIESPHTFFISETEVLTHNILPLAVGISFAFGLSEGIAFSGFTLGLTTIVMAGLSKLFGSKSHHIEFASNDENLQQSGSNNQNNFPMPSSSPEDPDKKDNQNEKTKHGAERASQRGFSDDELAHIRTSNNIKRQPDGGVVYIKEVTQDKFNVVIDNAAGKLITVFKTINQKALNGLARNYKWY